jgi:hypothetical protein
MDWYGLTLSGIGQGPVEGSCEHGNEPMGSIKYWEILEGLNDWWLPNERFQFHGGNLNCEKNTGKPITE